jgi:4-aminobutyrate aminotransferase-like enzyme
VTTTKTLQLLRDYESRNIVHIESDGSWPMVWEHARDVHVWDADGKKYLDLTAAFGVAAAGHANLRVVKAGQRQLARLPHAMGDVHPHPRKAELARALSRLTFERWSGGKNSGKVIFSNSGFEAVESALKTAMLATGKHGVIAFSGAYHGLGYGALNATHRDFFRGPFQAAASRIRSFRPVSIEDRRPGRRRMGHPPGSAARTDRRDSGRAGAGAGRHQYSAAGIFADAAPAVRRTWRAADSG